MCHSAEQDLFLNLQQRVADVSKEKEHLVEQNEQMSERLLAAEEKALSWQAEVRRWIKTNSMGQANAT